jgi:hypothetical protein
MFSATEPSEGRVYWLWCTDTVFVHHSECFDVRFGEAG